MGFGALSYSKKTSAQTRFIIGMVLGLAIAGAYLAIFSVTAFALSPLAPFALSGFAVFGIVLSIVGYLDHRKGKETLLSDFFFGLGMGIVIVSFLNAGYGSMALA
jgi:hypothetical protein